MTKVNSTLEQVDEGAAKFGDNTKKDIKGKGTLSLADGKTKTENVLYVKGLKQNLPSVSQLRDQGYNVTFLHQERWKLIVDAYKTSNNLYILNEINSERCYMGQEDKS